MALKQELDFHPQLLAMPETHLDAELMATSLENPPAEAIPPVSLVRRLAPATWRQLLLVMLQENLLAPAIQFLPKMVRREWANRPLPATLQEKSLAPANRRSVDGDLDSRQAERDSVQARHPAVRARLQELQLRPVEDSPVPPARARQHSQCPGPCASSPEIPAARKCSPAARCGGHPICARYRPPRNRRAPAGCGNKRSRSRRKHARPARTFPIAALDKYRCLPRRTAD
jgi:hypothetical protein